MARLTLASLGALPARVARPRYDPRRIDIGIVHLGLGAFARAHQAVYTDDVLASDPRWGICGASLKTPRATAALGAQDGLYTVLERSPAGDGARIVGAVRETLFLGSDGARLRTRIADPRVRVVTLTVTEKGYCHDPATGQLDPQHPEVVRDLAEPDAPVSAPGVLVAGLAARRAAGSGALTVVCCDNLPHNGRVVEGVVRAFARERAPDLEAWIGDHVRFPCTMVDRIVPATTERDVQDVRALLGLDDAVPVVCEPAIQWVLEDAFAAERPRWETAGAQLVADVAPFEMMKLRLLNGSHSTLAYLGHLLGHDYIWQAVRDPLLGVLVERLMHDEVRPTLAPAPGMDLDAYCRQLLVRFRNPALPHRTQQIAMDGSQKLPQRLLAPIRERLRAGEAVEHLTLAVAGWIRYASGTDEQGRAITISDPLAATFARIAREAGGDPARLAHAFLDLALVFGDLSTHAPFRARVVDHVRALVRLGTRATLARHLHRG